MQTRQTKQSPTGYPKSSTHSSANQNTHNDNKQEETPEIEKLDIESHSDKENTDKLPVESNATDSDDDDDDEDDSDDYDETSDDMFDGMSKEEKQQMKEAMNKIQNNYQIHLTEEKNRRIQEVKDCVQFNLNLLINDEESEFIAEFCEKHNENLFERLEDEGLLFVESMKEMLAQKKTARLSQHTQQNNNNVDDDDTNYDPENVSGSDEEWVLDVKRKKKQRSQQRKNKNLPKNTNLDGSQRCPRLLLNDALSSLATKEGWSDARKKAFEERARNPNAYFYRFNAPGQPQKNGKWTDKEHELFMKRVLEIGANDSWGIFSKKIPGRVGYQCSNYWRSLVIGGDVTDPNYHYDGNKLHFKRNPKGFAIKPEYRKYAITVNRDTSNVWKDLPKKHPKHPSDSYCMEVENAVNGSKLFDRKRKIKMNDNGNTNMENDGDVKMNQSNGSASTTKKRQSSKRRKTKRYSKSDDDDELFVCNVGRVGAVNDSDNPLPEFIDQMTGSQVIKPAISPYGHVLGYDTWTKILRTSKTKDLCPFTLQKMTRRSLVKLTKSNYDEYKDKIVNITQEQMNLFGLAKSAQGGDGYDDDDE